ncbi:MAG: hypothetical protein J7L73_08220 [Anaerolineales bacterium]|nr:hypothetical protein [Anaerolineales bacterium]
MPISRNKYLPDINRLSLVAATIMLAYLVGRFVNLPTQQINAQLPGFYISFVLNIKSLIAVIVGLLATIGADWMIQEHPSLQSRHTIEHWLLPALTTWVIGVPLYRLPIGSTWWFGFIAGSTLIMFVLVAEYIVVDRNDLRWAPAVIFINAISFALLLTFAIFIHSNNLRLYLMLPSIALAVSLVSLRVTKLRSQGNWLPLPALVITLITSQIAGALHYLPLTSIQFGLILLGVTYALITLSVGHPEKRAISQIIIEPTIILVTICLLALWIH